MTWGIANYSTTPGSNTAINGINIAPGCPSASVGPALRQLMADIAAALGGGQFIPTGAEFAFPVATAPAGYLAEDGSAVSRTTYAALFALIGTTFGAGDGSTTFNLPDARGRVIAGYDATNATGRLTGIGNGVSASTVGNTGGEQTHTIATAELPAHNHAITDPGHTHAVTDPGHSHTIGLQSYQTASQTGFSGAAIGGSMSTNTNTTGISLAAATTGITTANVGSGTAANVVQPTTIRLWCIKT